MVKNIIINKFGGGILADAQMYKLALNHLSSQIKLGKSPIIVVAALKDVTDSLIEIINTLKDDRKNTCLSLSAIEGFVNSLENKHRNVLKKLGFGLNEELIVENEMKKLLNDLFEDLQAICKFGMLDIIESKILAHGEKLSAVIFSKYLKINSIDSRVLFAEEVGIITNDEFLDADINFEEASKRVRDTIQKVKEVPVISGFTGITKEGQTTILGRGGADTTATFLGAVLDADKVNLWTSDNAVMSSDPDIVENAQTIPVINFLEAKESGNFVCSKAIQYLELKHIPCEIMNIKDKNVKTKISDIKSNEEGVKMIGFKNDLTLVKLQDKSVEKYGFLFRVSQIFNNNAINMVLIRNTRETMYIVIEESNDMKLSNALEQIRKNQIAVEQTQVSMITMVGTISWREVSQFNELLRKINGNAILGAFPYKGCIRLEAIISVIEKSKIKELVNLLHKKFVEI